MSRTQARKRPCSARVRGITVKNQTDPPESPTSGTEFEFHPIVTSGSADFKLRHDGGSCFRSGHYQAEIDHLGLECSPAFVYEPETNGVVEKFLQTLKEQVLWIERFDTLAQLRAASASSPRTSTSTGCSNATATAHPAKRAPPSPAPLKPWHDHRRQVSQVSGDPGAAQGLRRLTEARH